MSLKVHVYFYIYIYLYDKPTVGGWFVKRVYFFQLYFFIFYYMFIFFRLVLDTGVLVFCSWVSVRCWSF